MHDAPADLRRGRHEGYRGFRTLNDARAAHFLAYVDAIDRNSRFLGRELAASELLRHQQKALLDRLAFVNRGLRTNNVEIRLAIDAQEARLLRDDPKQREKYASVVLDRIAELVRVGAGGTQGGAG